jgi:hypothetical protein
MYSYAAGNGHADLSQRLGINQAHSLAIGGSANSRILRTTLKHSYQVAGPCFYVLGMTFVSREEIPILQEGDEFEGTWTNPQNQEFRERWSPHWSQADTDRFIEIKLRYEWVSILDRTEDLMYRMLATIHDLKSRGHRVLMFQQADNLYQEILDHPRLRLFVTNEIVEGFRWRAVSWQHEQGVPAMNYTTPLFHVPADMSHREPGQHQLLNEYLTQWIEDRKLLV